ncbi:MAG: hypothetical protein WKF76_00585 [Nocardioidaceae bacterium]
MSDDVERTEATTMSERIRDTMTERQRVNFERLFGPPDTATADDGGDAA